MTNNVQHTGFGKKLLEKAEQIAFVSGMNGVVIISGIGVREYYEKRGYYLENNYMVKDFMIYTVFRYIINKIIYNDIWLRLLLLSIVIGSYLFTITIINT